MGIQLQLLAVSFGVLVCFPLPQIFAGVLLLQSSDSTEYDFLGNFSHINITVLHLSPERLGFRDILETLVRQFAEMDKMAVVGSGDRRVDAIAALVADSVLLPFIGLEQLQQWPAKYSVALSPSPSDHAAAITSLALELGYSSIVSVTCEGGDEHATPGIQKRAREAYMVYQAASIKLGGTSFEASFSNITNLFFWLKHLPSSLVLLDCTSEEVCLLDNAARQLDLYEPGTLFWLMTRKSAFDVVSCPLSPTGLRSGLAVEHMVHDALSLLNRTILGHGLPTVGNTQHGNETSRANQRSPAASEAFMRSLLQQNFLGRTGRVKYGDRERYGAAYQIVKVEQSPNESGRWRTVGSVMSSKVTFRREFWTGIEQTQHENTLRVVLIEEEPLVSAYQLEEGELHCLLAHKCTKYVTVTENSSEPEAHKLERSCCRGFMIDILHSLERDLSVQADAYIVRDGKFGAIDPLTRQWNGMVKDLIDGEADVAITSLTISESRSEVIDFSNRFLVGQTKILISTRDIEQVFGLGFQFVNPFGFYLWLVTLLHIFVIWIVVWCLERCSPFGHRRTPVGSRKGAFPPTVCISYIWSNFCKLQVEDATPKSLSARLATAVFSFSSLILTTSYTANLAASLVSAEEANVVTGIMDPKFQNPPKGFRFATLRGSNTESMFVESDDPTFRRIGANMKPYGVSNYSEGLEKVRNGYLRALIYDSPFLDYGASKSPGCIFRVVGEPIRTKSFAFGFPKNSVWKKPITKLLLKYERKNYFDRLTKKWFKGSCLDPTSGNTLVAQRMGIFNLGGLFTICGCAILLCGLLLALEVVCFKASHARKSATFASSTTVDSSWL